MALIVTCSAQRKFQNSPPLTHRFICPANLWWNQFAGPNPQPRRAARHLLHIIRMHSLVGNAYISVDRSQQDALCKLGSCPCRRRRDRCSR